MHFTNHKTHKLNIHYEFTFLIHQIIVVQYIKSSHFTIIFELHANSSIRMQVYNIIIKNTYVCVIVTLAIGLYKTGRTQTHSFIISFHATDLIL